MSLVLRSGKEIAPMPEAGLTSTAVEQGKSEMIDSWLTDVGEPHSAGEDRQSESPDKATANGLGRPFSDRGEAENDPRTDCLDQEPEVSGLGRPDSLHDHGMDLQIFELADVGSRRGDFPQLLDYADKRAVDRAETKAGRQNKNDGAVGAVGALSRDDRSSVSQSSRSTSASSRAALAKAEKLVAEQRLLQLKNAQERRLKRLQLEFEQEQAEALEAAELAAIRARVFCGEEPAANVHALPVNRRSDSDSRSRPEPLLERGTFRTQQTSERSLADKIAMGMEALSTRMSLPPLEATKFDGDPAEYGRFVHRFTQLVHSSCLTESQKMSRLLQFVEGKAKGAIKGYEGVPHGYHCALDVLKRRFGEPHMIADACVSRLTCEQTLSKNDNEGLQVFADEVRTSYETLSSMDALGEMNSTNLRRLAGRLSIPDQAKWRDEAQRRRARGELPDFKCLVEFIERRAAAVNDPVFGNIGQHAPRDRRAQTTQPNPPRQRVTTMTTAITHKTTAGGDKKPAKCPLCDKPHQLDSCTEYVSKNPHQRKQILMEKKLCLNCLRPGHFVGSCRSKPQCRNCDQRHHSSIHKERSVSPPSPTEDSTSTRAASTEQSARDREGVAKKTFSAACMASKAASPKTVMLQVQAVKVVGHNGEELPTYALLDSGSEATFISRDLADRLRLPSICDGPATICTLGGERVISSRKVDITIKPIDDEATYKLQPRAQVLNDLVVDTASPQSLDPTAWPHLRDIKLPHLDHNNIGLIIGADMPEAHLQEEQRVGLRNEPMAIRTMLGWTLVGQVGETRSKRISSNLLMRAVEDNTLPLDLAMERFMNMDGLDAPGPEGNKLPSIGDQRVLAQMEETTELLNGRYAVGMLWKDKLTTMPNNRPQAEARLRGLERKLRRDSETRRKYSAFIDKLLMEGYARQLTTQEVETSTDKTWYLPHHAVIHPKKRKLRVVFDAAAKFQGKSLNSQLTQGPDLTNNLLGVLLRFRQGPVAMMADIEAMFHQVEVPQTDSDALRFLWWPDGDLDTKPATFKMLRHIFGATDSPCCANFALKKTARDHTQDFSKEAVETVQRDFYVDDLLKSVDSTEEGAILASELVRLLEEGGFNLTKWSSNNREVLRSIPAQDRARPDVDLALGELPEERALGVQWRTESDELIITASDVERPPTKRGVLSTLSSVYDPIGLVCPVVLRAKLIVQQLWKSKVEWDDELPEELFKEWQLWKDELTHLGYLQFPRCYHIADPSRVVDTQLHLFSDASENAYGACAYLRVAYLGHTDAHVCLVAGKARTAPVRPLSIPRLELQAAVLAVRLFHLLTSELTLAIARTTFWTDSQTTLQYIKNETKGFLPFVAHRVAEIRQSSNPSQWRHCPGKLNPSDLASRGLHPSAFLKQKVWFDGPEFLHLPEVEWPAVQDVAQVPDDNPEVKQRSLKVHHAEIKSDCLIDMIEAHSSWQKLQCSVAWLLRFCDWVKSRKSAGTNTVLDQQDYNHATLAIV